MGIKMRVRAAVILVVALLSSGCVATQSEIRTNEPYFTLTSTKPAKGLAKCIEQKMAAEAGHAFIVNFEEYPDGTCRVPLTALPNFAIADILVKPTDRGSVVEFRKGYLVTQPNLQEAIKRCVK